MKVIAVDKGGVSLGCLLDVVKQALPNAEVEGFSSAEEAVAAGGLDAYDVAFLEIALPGEDGVALAKRLQKANPKVNIVFATERDDFMRDALAMHCSGYLEKPITLAKVEHEMHDLRFPLSWDAPRLAVSCFGNFEATVDGEPLHFTRFKSKELLAYLVDRRGALCSIGEVEAVLWESKQYSSARKSHLRHLASDLARALREAGVDDTQVLQRRRGFMGVNRRMVDCDLYDYLDGGPDSAMLFQGEYMSQYCWAENTLAYLLRNQPAGKVNTKPGRARRFAERNLKL